MKRKRRKLSSNNSGAIADMAFLLLIFFMVTTSLQRQKSLSMSLPPYYDGPTGQASDSKVLSLLINADNQCMLEGENIQWIELQTKLKEQLNDVLNNTHKPIISLKIHQASNYDTYMQLLSVVKLAIREKKEEIAKQLFDKEFNLLSAHQLLELSRKINVKISESEFQL